MPGQARIPVNPELQDRDTLLGNDGGTGNTKNFRIGEVIDYTEESLTGKVQNKRLLAALEGEIDQSYLREVSTITTIGSRTATSTVLFSIPNTTTIQFVSPFPTIAVGDMVRFDHVTSGFRFRTTITATDANALQATVQDPIPGAAYGLDGANLLRIFSSTRVNVDTDFNVDGNFTVNGQPVATGAATSTLAIINNNAPNQEISIWDGTEAERQALVVAGTIDNDTYYIT